MDYQGMPPENSLPTPSRQSFHFQPRPDGPLPEPPNHATPTLHAPVALTAMGSYTPSECSSENDYATPRNYISPNVDPSGSQTPTETQSLDYATPRDYMSPNVDPWGSQTPKYNAQPDMSFGAPAMQPLDYATPQNHMSANVDPSGSQTPTGMPGGHPVQYNSQPDMSYGAPAMQPLDYATPQDHMSANVDPSRSQTPTGMSGGHPAQYNSQPDMSYGHGAQPGQSTAMQPLDYATPQDHMSANVDPSGSQTPTGMPGEYNSERDMHSYDVPSTTPMRPLDYATQYGAQSSGTTLSGGFHCADPWQSGPSTAPMQPTHDGGAGPSTTVMMLPNNNGGTEYEMHPTGLTIGIPIQNMDVVQPGASTPTQQSQNAMYVQPGPSTIPVQPIHNRFLFMHPSRVQSPGTTQSGGIQYVNPWQSGSSTPAQESQYTQPGSSTPAQESQNAMDYRQNVRARENEMPVPQGKIRFVDISKANDSEVMREKAKEERQKRRAAEGEVKRAKNELLEVRTQQAKENTKAMNEIRDANVRAEKAEIARKEMEREKEKMRVDYENSLATISQRYTNRTPLPQDQRQDAPTALKYKFTSQSEREDLQAKKIARNVGGDFLRLKRVNQDNSANGSGSDGDMSDNESDNEVFRMGKGKEKQNSRKKGSRFLANDERALKDLVKGILKEMGVARVTKSRRKVSRITALDQAKKNQQRNMTKDEDLAYKELVRAVFKRATKGNDDFAHYKPATDQQEADCGKLEGEKPLLGVSPFFFGTVFKLSMWNDILLRALVDDLRRMREAHSNKFGLPDVSTDYLLALFLNCLADAQAQWARQQPRLGETGDMTQARVQQFDERTKTAKNSRARKETKLKKRLTTVKKMTILCRGDAENIESWKWAKRLLELLGTVGMSSEEPKAYTMRVGDKTIRQTVHVIKICAWRPDKVTKALQCVDAAGEIISLKGGTAARARFRDDNNPTSESSAPQGLPGSLYDEEWMAEGLEMDPDFKNDLKVSDEAFELLEFAAEDLGHQADDENDVDDV